MKYIAFSAFLISILSAHAADLPATHESRESHLPNDETARARAVRSWKISLAPLVGSQALDAASSYGMRELNPWLASANGGFEMKATTMKLGVTGALVGIEYLVVRKYPGSARMIAKLNWTSGIVTTGFAIHNYAIK